MLYTVYKIKCGSGCEYIGLTSRPLVTRLTEHRSQSKKQSSVFHSCYSKKHTNWSIKKISQHASESEALDKERDLISRHPFCINRSTGGKGPEGVTRSEKNVRKAAGRFKLLWKTKRASMLKMVNAHKTKEHQSMAGKLGASARIATLPTLKVFILHRPFMEFRTAVEAASSLGISIHKIYRATANNTKIGQYRFSRRSSW